MSDNNNASPIDDLDYFLSHCERDQYRARATLVYTGDTSNSLYYIVKGSASVVVEDEQGHAMIVAYLHSGDFFGEMGLFADHHNRTARVISKTPCEIAKINYSDFNRLLEDHPDYLIAIASQMARRLRNTTEKARDLAFVDVTGRIARALLELCDQPEAEQVEDGVLIRVTRMEIAQLVSCTRELVGKILKNFEKQGLLQTRGRTLIINRTKTHENLQSEPAHAAEDV